MKLIMRVFGHYEPLETPNLIMIVSLIIRCIIRLLGFQCGALFKVSSKPSPYTRCLEPSVSSARASRRYHWQLSGHSESPFSQHTNEIEVIVTASPSSRHERDTAASYTCRRSNTHESLYGTRDGSDTLWNTTLRRPTGRSRVRYERRWPA